MQLFAHEARETDKLLFGCLPMLKGHLDLVQLDWSTGGQ